MVDDSKSFMVQILARTDAVHWPCGLWAENGRTQRVLAEARAQFFRQGVPPPSGRAEKNHSRMVAELSRGGVLHVAREKTKVLFCKLDWNFECSLRENIWLPAADAAYAVLAELTSREPRKLPGGEWWPEKFLSGVLPGDANFAPETSLARELVLPALTAGWLVSHATIHGAVFYAVTAAGRQRLTMPAPENTEQPFDKEAREIYDAEFKIYRDAIEKQEPSESREISIPLSF